MGFVRSLRLGGRVGGEDCGEGVARLDNEEMRAGWTMMEHDGNVPSCVNSNREWRFSGEPILKIVLYSSALRILNTVDWDFPWRFFCRPLHSKTYVLVAHPQSVLPNETLFNSHPYCQKAR